MSVHSKSKSIVVVDDEPDICEALELALGLEGYRVTAATSRDAALKIIGQSEPVIVLLDYRMPGLDPKQFIAQLRAQVHACIVLMTAGKDPGERARELGLKHFLSKPFELDAMLDVVRKCASEPQEEH